ncbi:MAG: DUF481 domain-containing protein [Pseudomonadales bacterium]|nr:DUF481 domain-containing protein [Pseudomonadales bacterium]
MNNKIRRVLLTTLIVGSPAFAEEVVDESVNEWKGAGEVGISNTTGNTETQSVNLALAGVRSIDLWSYLLDFTMHYKTDDDEATAEKYFGQAKAEWKFTDRDYAFGLINYENDKFSGFNYQSNLIGGVGTRFINEDTMTLDAEAGLGMRFNEVDSGKTVNEAVVRLAGDYNWKISKTSAFQQKLSIEPGEESTIVRSYTALSANVADNLAMKASFEVKYASDVPVGSDNTDTTTLLALVYDF